MTPFWETIPNRPYRRLHSTIVWALCCSLLPLPALAQSSPNPSDIATARTIGIEGVKLAKAGNCTAAVEKLKRAEELYHAPSILFELGKCQISLGKLVAGTENLQRVVREQLDPKAPKAFRTAQEHARSLLDTTLPRLAHLRIELEGLDGNVVPQLSVDDVPVSQAALGVERVIDPGTHEIKASAPGYKSVKMSVSVKESAHETAKIRLEVDPNAKISEPPPVPTNSSAARDPLTPPPQPVPHTSESDRTLAYVSLGIGATGIALGTILGLAALGKKGTLDENCPTPERCPARFDSDINTMKGLGTGSTIAFGVGGAGIALGIILLVTQRSSSETVPTAQRFQPWVGPRSAGFTTHFY
jgi:hypothetical protein